MSNRTNKYADKAKTPEMVIDGEKGIVPDFDLKIKNLSNSLAIFDQKESILILSKLVPEWKVASYLL